MIVRRARYKNTLRRAARELIPVVRSALYRLVFISVTFVFCGTPLGFCIKMREVGNVTILNPPIFL